MGRQAASYLAQEQAAQALAEARQFEALNRRIAFVLHDIKNVVSQLSLMVRNAEKHKHNPAFQEDMIQTVSESVERMNRLLVRLQNRSPEAEPTAAVALAPLLREAVAAKAGARAAVTFDCRAEDLARRRRRRTPGRRHRALDPECHRSLAC